MSASAAPARKILELDGIHTYYGSIHALKGVTLDVVAMLADKVVVLDHGEKIAEGPPAVVRRDEEVIRAYLGRSAVFA